MKKIFSVALLALFVSAIPASAQCASYPRHIGRHAVKASAKATYAGGKAFAKGSAKFAKAFGKAAWKIGVVLF